MYSLQTNLNNKWILICYNSIKNRVTLTRLTNSKKQSMKCSLIVWIETKIKYFSKTRSQILARPQYKHLVLLANKLIIQLSNIMKFLKIMTAKNKLTIKNRRKKQLLRQRRFNHKRKGNNNWWKGTWLTSSDDLVSY